MTVLTLPERNLEILAGTLDENFRYLGERLRVRLTARGDTVSVDGDPEAVELTGKLLQALGKLVGNAVQRAEPHDRLVELLFQLLARHDLDVPAAELAG